MKSPPHFEAGENVFIFPMEKTLQVIEEMVLAAIALQTGRSKDRERAVRLQKN